VAAGAHYDAAHVPYEKGLGSEFCVLALNFWRKIWLAEGMDQIVPAPRKSIFPYEEMIDIE